MESIPLMSTARWEATDNAHEQKLIVGPLFPGYGTTLGNALRRVLLNSLVGAAVVAVRIDEVSHEFSTISNIKEDVVELLLNIKQLRFRLHGQEPVTVRLEASGQKTVTAGDIEPLSDVEIVQPHQAIATLTSKDAKLSMELMVEKGRGYVPTEARDSREKLPIGTIAVDAIFTPVRNVGISVENVRVGQMTNYDQMTLTVQTDGTISAQEAVKQALDILMEQFGHLKTLLAGGGIPESEEKVEAEEVRPQQEEE